mmetsp:Transcript_15079/g.45213  ORF Transcript_15079/g.45213 Transcript_15079/m.45213 type:complete len:331 (-) Transcript_15079:85-1077(-)
MPAQGGRVRRRPHAASSSGADVRGDLRGDHRRRRGRLQDGRPREALRLPDAHEELRGWLHDARGGRDGHAGDLLRHGRGVHAPHPDRRAVRGCAGVYQALPDVRGRHCGRGGPGGPRRLLLLRIGRALHHRQGPCAGPAQLPELGSPPTDERRGRLRWEDEQARGLLLLLLAGGDLPPDPRGVSPAGRAGCAAGEASLVRPAAPADVRLPGVPAPGRWSAGQAREVRRLLPHVLLAERSGRLAVRSRRRGPGRRQPREPAGAHRPLLQRAHRQGGAKDGVLRGCGTGCGRRQDHRRLRGSRGRDGAEARAPRPVTGPAHVGLATRCYPDA